MGKGADLSKMKPPVAYKNTTSLYGIEESDMSVLREQSEICKGCLQNQKIKIDDLMSQVLKKDPDFKKKVKEANRPCCTIKKWDNGNRYPACDTFVNIIRAYAKNVKSQGLTMDPCRFCCKHIDNDPLGHGHKACNGKSQLFDDSGCSLIKECITLVEGKKVEKKPPTPLPSKVKPDCEYTKETSCAFTGHRPGKLPGGYDWSDPRNEALMKVMRATIMDLIENHGVNVFVCGGALGIDQMAFSICTELKDTKYPHIKTVIAMPFKNQSSKWQKIDQLILFSQKRLADDVVLVDELDSYKIAGLPTSIYHPAKMQKRNEFMVDTTKYLIAIWDGSKSGTGNCVNYAKRKGNTVIRIDPIA